MLRVKASKKLFYIFYGTLQIFEVPEKSQIALDAPV